MQAYKPGSVTELQSSPAICHLSRPDLADRLYRSTHPEVPHSGSRTSNPSLGAYLIFQPIRFTMQQQSPTARWALTPPFHPYPDITSQAVYSLWHCL